MFVMVGSKKARRLAFLIGGMLDRAPLNKDIKEIAEIIGVVSPAKPKAITRKQSGRRVAATSVRAGGGCTSPVLAGAGRERPHINRFGSRRQWKEVSPRRWVEP